MVFAVGTKIPLTPEETSQGISLMNPATPHSIEYKDDKAEKINIALGPNLSPGAPSIRAALETQTQDRFAELLAQRKAVELQDVRNSIVAEIASQRGGSPTQLDVEVVKGLTEEDLSSPDLSTILEQEYARKITDLSATLLNEETGLADEAYAANPEATLDIMDRVEDASARNMIAADMLDEVRTLYNKSGIISQGFAWAQAFIPFLSWVQYENFTDSPFKAFLPGDTIEAQITYLHSLSPSKAKALLRQGVDKAVGEGNYLGAMTFLEAFLSYSDTDKSIENIFAGIDIASFLPIKLFAKGLKGASKAVITPTKEMAEMATRAGLEKEAARITFTRALEARKLPGQDIRRIGDVEQLVESIARPQEAWAGRPLRASAAVVNRLAQASLNRAGKALEILGDLNRVERLTPQALELAFKETEDELWSTFNHANHNVVHVSRDAAEDSLGNVYQVSVQWGKKDGSAYGSKLSAEKAAKNWFKFKTDDYSILETDHGWVIETKKYVDETKSSVRDLEIETENVTPDTFDRRFLSFVYGADRKVSVEQTRARSVATQTSEHMSALLEELAAPFRALSKTEKKDMEKFFTKSRDHVGTDGVGLTYKTAADFEDAFNAMFSRLPSEAELDAWNAFKQAYDLDFIIRDLDVFKQKAIMGVEEFSFKVGENFVNMEGKALSALPRGTTKPFRIGVVDGSGNVLKGQNYFSASMSTKDWTRIQEIIDNGFEIIQPYKGFTKLGDEYFNFVLVKSPKRNRVGLLNMKYSDGSRMMAKYPNYVKQAKVAVKNGRGRYLGDNSIVNARSADEAKFITKTLETVRQMMRNGDPTVAKYFEDNLPVFPFTRFKEMVDKKEIDLNIPFTSTKAGARTIDSADIEKAARDGHGINSFDVDSEFDLSRNVRARFVGDRADESMETWATEKDTIFKFEGDNLVSPYDTLRMSMSNMIDVHVLNDYRIKSIRDFTKEFRDLLDGTEADFNANGFAFILEPKYRNGADPNRVKVAENVRKSVLNLFNHRTFLDRQVDAYKERIVRSLGSKFGDRAEWLADNALTKIGNADKYMRWVAFQTKMGFFNPKQFFLQASTSLMAIAIAPTHGLRAAKVASALQMSAYAKKEWVRAMGQKLSGLSGWSADEFEELRDAYYRSGFGHVGGDVSFIDDLSPPKLSKSKVGTVLFDWGTEPFRAGERTARSVAFATAYSERKKLIKGRPLTRSDEAWILKRATDMTGNMTRDSNALWQNGLGSVLTQFMGYQMRLMELMIGNKLTGMEKARLFGTMSLMYGVPTAAGMSTGVVPIREWLRDELAKNGVQYDNTPYEPFIDGFAASFVELLSGHDFNVAEKYGPGGLTTFYDVIKGDIDYYEVLQGASGGIIGDMWMDTAPSVYGMFAAANPNDDVVFPITVQDLIEPFRNISTVNNTVKLYEAVNLKRWISQNENILTENVDAMEAVVSAVFGLDPDRVSDAFTQMGAMESIKASKASAQKSMIADYRRAIIAMRDGNLDEAKKLFSRAKSHGILAGFNNREFRDAYRRALDEEPLDESILRRYEEIVKDATGRS